jgi:uncharacterized protein YbjQ (UPF0145 family)
MPAERARVKPGVRHLLLAKGEIMRTSFVLVISSSIFTACSPFIPVVKVGELPAEKQSALMTIKTYEPPELVGVSYEVVGELTGNSCKNLLWDRPASREDAVNQMRYLALERGANGITEIKCEPPRGTSLETNCWESITCTSKAVKFQSK